MLDQNELNVLREQSIPAQSLLVGGKWRAAQSEETMAVTSPIDGRQLTTIAAAGPVDVDAAVSAARRAYQDGVWSRMAPAGRKKVLHRLADLIEAHALELAVLGVRDNGTEIGMAIGAEPGSAAATFRHAAEAIDKIYGDIAPTPPGTLGLVHKGPVGVVGAIIPWNFPLMIGAWKLAPALAMGNSVVLKPAEVASLSILRLAELALEAGLPEGVLNVVTGPGTITGEALGLHMDVDVLVFTGSGGVGRRLMEYSARSNLKKVYLELGGKSPNIVFADAGNLDTAAKTAAMGIFRNSGQVCVAASRLLVEAPIHADFVARVKQEAEALRVGDPLNLNNQVGAVSSEAQLSTILSHVDVARTNGADCITGGERILAETGGSYMAPTIFDNVSPDMKLAQSEVFGPVLAVTPFGDEAEAISVANDTEYGLSSAVWTDNIARAHRMVMAIDAGLVHVNCYGGADITVPLTGHKQSGNGSDKSLYSFDKYLALKTAWINLGG